MTSATDEEPVTFTRSVADIQKAASAALCLVAAGLIVYTGVNGVWSHALPFLVGLALAAQSYRVAQDGAPTVEVERNGR